MSFDSIKMVNTGNHIITVLLFISFVLTGIVAILAISGAIRSMICKRMPHSKLIWYLLLLVLSVWSLRFSVGYFMLLSSKCGTAYQSIFEEVMSCLIHTFQTFSMDEDYQAYIDNGKKMMSWLTNGNTFWIGAYGIYASILNVLAPICGGTMLISILQGVFPGVKLFFSRLTFWRTEYYFSELNERSLASATSIINKQWELFRKPILIFTDVYSDGENEKSSELLIKAKSIGAICLNDDLTHLRYNKSTHKELWLMDEAEMDNIRLFAELAGENHFRIICNTVIRIFYQNDSFLLTEQQIFSKMYGSFRKNLEKNKFRIFCFSLQFSRYLKQLAVKELLALNNDMTTKAVCEKKTMIQNHLMKEAEDRLRSQSIASIDSRQIKTEMIIGALLSKTVPVVLRTRCYQNLVFDLLEKKPLYLPLLNRQDVSGLDVAIIGNGNIGMEMLLSCTWCGQILDVPLSINLVSMDARRDAMAKIDLVNTDILQSAKEKIGNLLLAKYPDAKNNPNDYGEPYFTFRYCEADLDYENVESLSCTSDAGYYDSIADRSMPLTDADYYLVALGSYEANIRIAEALCAAISRKQKISKKKKPVLINYVVEDSYLCATLNQNGPLTGDKHIQMNAVGALTDLYHYDTIHMKSLQEEADKINKQYAVLSGSRQGTDRYENAYNFRSSSTRAIHFSYKVFSAYLYEIRNGSTAIAWDAWKSAHTSYICKSNARELGKLLGWLDHRRWNAYMRSVGFQHDAETKKDIISKLHCCLVESKRRTEESARDDLLDIAMRKYHQIYKIYDMISIMEEPMYQPKPVNTDQIKLTGNLEELTEKLAENVHEEWALGRMIEGWTYGEKRDEAKKETPCLVPYQDLPESEKEYDRKTAMQTLKLLIAMGYEIEKKADTADHV